MKKQTRRICNSRGMVLHDWNPRPKQIYRVAHPIMQIGFSELFKRVPLARGPLLQLTTAQGGGRGTPKIKHDETSLHDGFVKFKNDATWGRMILANDTSDRARYGTFLLEVQPCTLEAANFATNLGNLRRARDKPNLAKERSSKNRH